MSAIGVAIGGALGTAVTGGIIGLGGAYLTAEAQSDAAMAAGDAQAAASMMSIEEQRRQFDVMQEILKPYTQAGESALAAQMDLLGLSGEEAQQAAISNIENSAAFQAQIKAGEEAMLQQASATGGLRGGNVQAALAQYRPQMLAQEINNQYANLGTVAGLGQASATNTAANAMNLGTNIASDYSNIGAAQAGTYLAQGQATAGLISSAVNPISTIIGAF